jgi:hypothetical protein
MRRQRSGDRLTQVRTLLLLLLLLLLQAAPVAAQRAVTVPASSDVYDRLESVAARFPARGVHLGHRPLSRFAAKRVIARLRVVVDAAPESDERRWAREQLDYLDDAVRDEPASDVITARTAWRGSQVASNALVDRFAGNGLGLIDAESQAFAATRQGEPVGKGTVAELMPVAALGIGQHFGATAEPHIALFSLHESSGTASGLGSRLYARAVARNVAIEAGADDRRWGQSPIGAQFISGNAAPLPAITVSSDTAFELPWLFRRAGPLRTTLFVADLGASQVPSHARLAGWQVSMQPWSRMELGVDVLAQTGGSGAPKATFAQRVADILVLPDQLSASHSDLQISNKLAGGNLLLRFPSLSGLEIYYELQLDDFDARRLRSSFTDDGAHLLGARMSTQLAPGRGELIWRAEWHRTSLRLYEHAQFISGVTYRERIIGDPLGPNAGAAYVSSTWQRTPVQSFSLSLADERRNPSQYTVVVDDSLDRGFRFVRLSHDPDYRRFRVTGAASRALGPGTIQFSGGYNRAWRAGQSGRNEWMAALAISALAPRAF